MNSIWHSTVRRVTAIVIGGGHNGLAMSTNLAQQGIDHLVLERGEIANTWRNERWDSLRLLTPNWQCQLPGMSYGGPDPDGFMYSSEIVEFINQYAAVNTSPVNLSTNVISVKPCESGYRVETNQGPWDCRIVVMANGHFSVPNIPAVASAVPNSINMISARDYKNCDQLDEGSVLVIGASATGLQLANEIRNSGRQVRLSVGEHVRMPRTYRGRDIQWWMNAMGLLRQSIEEVDDITRVRGIPSPQLVGTEDRSTLDLNRLLLSIDEWIEQNDSGYEIPAERFEPTQIDKAPEMTLNLSDGEIRTIIWATGYKDDFSFLKAPVFDPRDRLRHNGGIVIDGAGLYTMGSTFMRRRQSSFISGAVDDARELSDHIAAFIRDTYCTQKSRASLAISP